jgi:hypothetical protein
MLNSSLLLIISLILSSSAFGSVTNYKNILIGDRAATMGGAYVAVSDDSSGTYYNPAGISYTSGTEISGSANVYHVQHTTYKNTIRDQNWERHSVELLPNFFSLIRNYGKNAYGISFVVPDSFVQHQDQIYTDLPATETKDPISRYVLNLHNEDITYLIGPTYSRKLTDTLSIGITLNYMYRKERLQQYQLVEYPSAAQEISYANREWGEKGIMPKVGLLWSPIDLLSFGLVVSKTFLLKSEYISMSNFKADSSNDLTFSNATYDIKRNMPTEVALGVAYFPSPFFLVSLDSSIHIAPKADSFNAYGYKTVANVSLGAEYFLNEKNAVRAGVFTNFSNMPTPTAQTAYIEKIDQYGFTAGYSIYTRSTSITLGVIASFGTGHNQPYAPDSTTGLSTTVEATRYSYTGVISTSYGF